MIYFNFIRIKNIKNFTETNNDDFFTLIIHVIDIKYVFFTLIIHIIDVSVTFLLEMILKITNNKF